MKPSGWPTCRPEPDGYGNMSRTKYFLPGTGASVASGPDGFGASNVPCCAQYACQRASISPAIAAVYRKAGSSVAGGLLSLMRSPQGVCPSTTGSMAPAGAGPLCRAERCWRQKCENPSRRRGRHAEEPGIGALSLSARPGKEQAYCVHGNRVPPRPGSPGDMHMVGMAGNVLLDTASLSV